MSSTRGPARASSTCCASGSAFPGAKGACEQGECGSCSVLVDGQLLCSCLVLAATAVGSEITTVEGLAGRDAQSLSDVQRAFVAEGAVQCGFCTPGLIVAVHDLLDRDPESRPADGAGGALGQPVSLHRLRADLRGGRGRRSGEGGTVTDTEIAATGVRVAASGRSSARAPRAPTRSRRCRAGSRSRPTCGPTGWCGARRLRSPHPHARIRRLDVSPAWRIPGVEVVVTAEDVPGATYGLISADQPVFASDTVLYAGQAVAAVAADHPETARRACEAIIVEYEVLEPLTDPERAIEAPPIHPDGNVFRHQRIERGDASASSATSSSRAPTTSACRTRRSSASSRRSPSPTTTAAASSCSSRRSGCTRTAARSRSASACPRRRCASSSSGVGGAFGAREDVSLQVHVCLLALRAGRPVKMMYGRDESFLGHVHRHPGRIWMRHHARADGTLVNLECRVLLDGGAYASTSSAVLINAITHVQGPYRLPNATVDGWAVRTNNPPCGAMRGFGVQQACFAHESQMDRLAAAVGLDPVEIRLRNAIETGDLLITGQRLESVAPTVAMPA